MNNRIPMKDSRALLCVAIGVTDWSEALRLVAQEKDFADVLEIRLDCLRERVITPFIEATDTPLLFTTRADWEGGAFQGEESERIALLAQAAEAGAAYVDCELRAPVSSLKRLKEHIAGSKTKLILSWHDFEITPPKKELQKTLESMQKQGAHVGKIVTTAHDFHDVLRVLNLQEAAYECGLPLIAFCMGKPGMISRLATLELGGYMTYCSPRDNSGTASGQISSSDMRSMLATFA